MKDRRASSTWGGALAAGLTVGIAAFVGCSASDGPQGAASSAVGGGGSGGGHEGGGGLGIGGGNGHGGDGGACVATHAQTSLVPLDIAILIDKSGSMLNDGKWDAVTDALDDFVTDPASEGIAVGLSFFPDDTAVLPCDYQDYQSLAVPIGLLPQNENALANKIDTTMPGGNTPMYAAVKGTLLFTSGYKDAHPTHRVVLVFASDGVPGSCADDQNEIATIADVVQAAYEYNGLETYVIAIQGTDVPSLDLLAAAGGTGQAYDVTDDVSQFSTKMAEIRGAALPCNFTIPPPPAGEQLDPGEVNVGYTPGGETDAETVPKVDGLDACGDEAGWYYGSGDPPAEIILCPASCQEVQADTGAKLEVLFGCLTIVK